MAQQPERGTVEEFEAFVLLPENAERLFEFIGGEIVEVPPSPYCSAIACQIAAYLAGYDNIHVTGAGAGYALDNERYHPRVACVMNIRLPVLPFEGYVSLAPDLAVEVVSPCDSQEQLLTKVTNYLAAGTLVWVAYPAKKQVGVYAPGQPAVILDVSGTLDGGAVLPGFKLAVKDIFPD